MNTLVCIPAYNESQAIGQTLKQLRRHLAARPEFHILVVDDGSSDTTAQIAKDHGAKVLVHPLNRGLGGAIGTGLAYALKHGYQCLVTFDADGQHSPQDLLKLVRPIQKHQADVVIGSRTISDRGQLPPDRKLIIALSNFLTRLLFGQATTDSLSGFRAFNRRAITSIRLRTDRMEVSNEFFVEIKRNRLKLIEVPIKIIYTPYSRAKGQSNLNSINILYKLFLRLFR